MTHTIHEGDCLTILPTIPDKSIDLLLTDPPYPEVEKDYGFWSQEDWHKLMKAVLPEAKRVLKPSGSAVFVLQPNGEVGAMRPWLWEFVVYAMKDWNLIQDVWWWNSTSLPNTWAQRRVGLLRTSVKQCVWLGPKDCYRNQDAVLWSPSDAMKAKKWSERATRELRPSGYSGNENRFIEIVKERGGTTPFNLLPIPNCNSTDSSGVYGHGAGTPEALCDWWIRYAAPDNGTVLDPFSGLASVGAAALRQKRGLQFIGIEKVKDYCEKSKERLKAATA